jgi:hypothetical protein
MRRSLLSASLVVLMLIGWSYAATKGAGLTTTAPVKLTWNIQPNNQFVYTLNSSMTVTADSNVWALIDNYVIHTMNYSSSFSSQNMLNAFLSSWPVNIQVLITIEAITGKYIDNSYIGTSYNGYNGLIEYYYQDTINVSLQIKQSGDTTWGSPNSWLSDLGTAYLTFEAQLANVSTSSTSFTQQLGSMKTDILTADYSNFAFINWISGFYSNDSYEYYYAYSQPDPYYYFGDTGAPLPTYPMDAHMGMPLAWMILPQGYDFTQMMNWLKSSYQIQYNYQLSEGYSTDTMFSTDQLLNVLNQTGVNVTVQQRALSISQKFASMSQNANWFQYMMGNLSSLYGVHITDEDFYTGVEYVNSTGMLNAWATYFDANLVLNLTEISPSLVSTHISFSGFISITSNNTTPITESNLQNGVIGSARAQPSGGLSIPSYSLAIISIVGVITTIAIIIKNRKYSHKLIQ